MVEEHDIKSMKADELRLLARHAFSNMHEKGDSGLKVYNEWLRVHSAAVEELYERAKSSDNGLKMRKETEKWMSIFN